MSISAGESRKQVLSERLGPFRRSYRLHVPEAVEVPDGMRRPLVVALHGGFARGAILERQSGLSELADREGFFVVYPNGFGVFGLLRHWNGGWCCGGAKRRDVDDVAFLDRVVAHVAARHPVDAERVIVIGYSNGGMLAYRYAARRPERVAGLGIYASSPGLEDAVGDPLWLPPAQDRPVRAVVVHGTADPRLPVAGSRGDASGRGTLGAEDAASLWARRNGCAERPAERDEPPAPGARTLVWCAGAPSEVTLDLLAGWGHDWPSRRATSAPRAPDGLRGYDAAERMWRALAPPRR